MKVCITDICGGCCPENAVIGTEDRELTERIKSRVFENIGVQPPKKAQEGRKRRTLRTVLLAAAIAAMLSVTAYAVASFTMNREVIPAGEGVTGRWTYAGADGSILKDSRADYPYASMVFSFTGSEEAHGKPQFRCFWLPEEPSYGKTDEDGWTDYLTNDGDGCSNSIPYVIGIENVPTYNCRYIINGDAEVTDEYDWGEWHVTEITSDYSGADGFDYANDRANYILLFDAGRGYLVSICGTDDMETLRHIARELEIRESGTPYVPNDSAIESFGILEPGRG